MMKDKLLTPKEVAEIFRVDPATVRDWAEEGKIEYVLLPGNEGYKQYRFRQSVVDTILKGGNIDGSLPQQ